jgi:hypothetical protein
MPVRRIHQLAATIRCRLPTSTTTQLPYTFPLNHHDHEPTPSSSSRCRLAIDQQYFMKTTLTSASIACDLSR